MTTKEYLSQARHLDQRIKSDQALLQELREMSTGLRALDYSVLKVKSSGANNQADFTQVLEKISELESDLLLKVNKSVGLKAEIMGAVEKIENPEHQYLLRCRYIQGLSWAETALALGYSEAHTYTIHRRALKKLIVNNSKK